MTACLENEIEFRFWNHIYKEILYALVTFDRMEYFLIFQNIITQIEKKKNIILYTLNSNQKGFFWILFKFWIIWFFYLYWRMNNIQQTVFYNF